MLENLDLSRASQDTLQALRLRAKESLFFFAKGVLGLSKLNLRIHGPICKLLEDQEQRRAVKITLPRGWYKTSLVSLAYPLWRVVNDPNIRIVLIQNTHQNAEAKLKMISGQVLTNQLFRVLFPEILPTPKQTWIKDRLEFCRDKPAAECTIEAAGIATQLVSRHYDLVIEDDTVAPDASDLGEEVVAPTKDQIAQAIGYHTYMVPPLFSDIKTGENIVVGTRWFEHDLLSFVEEKEPHYVSYSRAVRETDGLPNEMGEPAFPEQFPSDELDKLSAKMGPYMFSCLYMNKPMRSGDMIFRPEWFRYYETPPRDFVTYLSVDPAGDPEDTKGDPDYNVVAVCGKDLITGRVYLLDYFRGRVSVSELLDQFFRLAETYKPVWCGIEAVAYQKTLLHLLREQMKARKTWYNIEGITWSRKSKNARIMGLQPLLANEQFFLRRHHQEFVREALAFPYGRNDDVIDAVSMQTQAWGLTKSKTEAQIERYDDPFSLDQAIADIRAGHRDQTPRYLDCLRTRRRYPTPQRTSRFMRG